MDTIKTYPVGNGEITLTESDAEELRIMLQTDYLKRTIESLFRENRECFYFSGPSVLRHFVDEVVRMHDDYVNYDSSYFEEIMEENIFNRAAEHNLRR